jgi:hypothetical protein
MIASLPGGRSRIHQQLERLRRPDRRNVARRFNQDVDDVVGAAPPNRGNSTNVRELGSKNGLCDERRCLARQVNCRLVPPGETQVAGGADESSTSACGVCGELGGAPQRPGGGDVACSIRSPRGHPLERGRGVFVRFERTSRQMPGAPISMLLVLSESVRERAVSGAPLTRGCRLVNRRPDERMAELEPVPVDEDEAGLLGKVERAGTGIEVRGGAGDESGVLGIVCGREQQNALRLIRQPSNPLEERSLYLARQRQGLR